MPDIDLTDVTDVDLPLIVDSANEVDWSEEADLIVVGFGGAGAAASLEAREQGVSTIVVDRFDGGGATAYSGGIFYAGATRYQREAGVEDSAAEMFKYLRAENAPVSDETLMRFCEGSSDAIDWVGRYVPYGSELYSGKATFPPAGKFLYYSGNEKTAYYAERANPAARGHRAVGKSYTGHVFYTGLREAALSAGARLIPHAPARRLVVDHQGTVIGLQVDQMPDEVIPKHRKLYKRVNPQVPLSGKRAEKAIEECRKLEKTVGIPKFIRAHSGVILSTGGFAYNVGMLGKYRPELASAYAEILRLGSLGCDGSGIALGQSVGGTTDLMKNAYVGKNISPPETYLKGILINREGRRFINEDAYIGVVGDAISQQSGGGAAWLVLDNSTYWKALWDSMTMGLDSIFFYGIPALLNAVFGRPRKGRTLAALAKKCGIDALALESSVSNYNQAIVTGNPDDLGKLASNSAPIGKGPFWALDCGTTNKFAMTMVFTLGGLRVDEKTGAVLQVNDDPVRGLYAAGRTAVGVCSGGYQSGMSLADLVFSGRRAAASIAASARTMVD